ncbi:8504_t:CDS:1, partial [Ambispora gerdemannii]
HIQTIPTHEHTSSTMPHDVKQKDDKCHKEACEIQTCLSQHNYNEQKCEDVINKFRECCYKLSEIGGQSVSCSGVVRKKKQVNIEE